MTVKSYDIKNYYKILGINSQAPTDTIKKKYRVLAFAHHPDKHNNSDAANQHFTLINEAYAVLSNPSKRQAYDLQLLQKNLNYFQDYSFENDVKAILRNLQQVLFKVQSISSDDINQSELSNSIIYYYTNENQLLFEEQKNKELQEQYLNILIDLFQPLKYKYASFVLTNIEEYLRKQEETMLILYKIIFNKKQIHQWNKLKPILVLCSALIICFIIFIVSRR